MNIIQENNWAITTKKGKGKLPLFRGNVEQVIPIYVDGEVVLSYFSMSVPESDFDLLRLFLKVHLSKIKTNVFIY